MVQTPGALAGAPASKFIEWRFAARNRAAGSCMRSWSIPLGRFFGANVRLHLTFLLLLIYIWATEVYYHPPQEWWRALAVVGIVFGAVVLHELGHALGALRSGGGVGRSLVLMPIGSATIL